MPGRIEITVNVPDAFAEGADVPPAAALRRLLRDAAAHTLAAEAVSAAEISVTLLDDPAMTDLNRQYLGHDHTTDVLAFALHGEGEPPLGDVYVGGAQALRQAAEHGEQPRIELARLVVHGTLHVLGHDHPEGGDRMESEMWRRQETILGTVIGP